MEVASNLISGGSTLTTTLPFGALELSLAASSESGIPGAEPTTNELFIGFNYTLGNARVSINRN